MKNVLIDKQVSNLADDEHKELIQRLENNYLFFESTRDQLYPKVTDDMLTPEALEKCVKLWEDMAEKTYHANTNDIPTVTTAYRSQEIFSSSKCSWTQIMWYK